MPVYNGEKYLSEAIESILNQTYKKFELIIVDDGSVDDSINIINKYCRRDKRIVLIVNKENLGTSRSLNKAVLASKGKYIARLDCDDVSRADRIYHQVAILENNKKIDVCGTWGILIEENGHEIGKLRTLTGAILNYNYWKTSPFISSSTMYRKTVFRNNIFDPNSIVEDYDILLRIKNKFNFYNIKKYLVLYRKSNNGISVRYPQIQKIASKKSLLKHIKLRKISLEEYSSLVCFEFKIGFRDRWNLLMEVQKKIDYPEWVAVLDNTYYLLRKISRLL